MIELKIPIKEAVSMLTERMEFELKLRGDSNSELRGVQLKDLTFKELVSIAEVATFDLVFLLPVEVFEEENNLADIITKSMHALADIFLIEDFLYYKHKSAVKLISKIQNVVKNAKEMEVFSAN